MATLVLGASGATGKQLVEQLLKMQQKIKVIVRPTGEIPNSWENNDNITIIRGLISETSVDDMVEYLTDCESVVSCLGHNITLKGIYGKPRKLVTDAVKLVCVTIEKITPKKPVKFVLMNTTSNRNRDLDEHISMTEKLIMGIIRQMVPPQSDNENAADFLRVKIGQNNKYIEWVAVRPDGLTDENNVTEYEIFGSPTRSALFNPGQTSRINVGNFMARLIKDNELWNLWKGQMPVIYNKT